MRDVGEMYFVTNESGVQGIGTQDMSIDNLGLGQCVNNLIGPR